MHIHTKLHFYKLIYGLNLTLDHTYIHTKSEHTRFLAEIGTTHQPSCESLGAWSQRRSSNANSPGRWKGGKQQIQFSPCLHGAVIQDSLNPSSAAFFISPLGRLSPFHLFFSSLFLHFCTASHTRPQWRHIPPDYPAAIYPCAFFILIFSLDWSLRCLKKWFTDLGLHRLTAFLIFLVTITSFSDYHLFFFPRTNFSAFP